MKISKNLLAAGFLIIAMLVTESSLALTLGSQSIAEAYQSSDVVIIGIVQSQEINRVNDTLCGTRYTANVLQRLKWKPGDDTTPVISFGRFPGLGSGKKYVLFLKYVASANEMLEDLKRYVQVVETNEEALELVKCKNIVPGYYVDLSKAWEISNKTVIINPDKIRMPLICNVFFLPTLAIMLSPAKRPAVIMIIKEA